MTRGLSLEKLISKKLTPTAKGTDLPGQVAYWRRNRTGRPKWTKLWDRKYWEVY